jgi:hypothetical protein
MYSYYKKQKCTPKKCKNDENIKPPAGDLHNLEFYRVETRSNQATGTGRSITTTLYKTIQGYVKTNGRQGEVIQDNQIPTLVNFTVITCEYFPEIFLPGNGVKSIIKVRSPKQNADYELEISSELGIENVNLSDVQLKIPCQLRSKK